VSLVQPDLVLNSSGGGFLVCWGVDAQPKAVKSPKKGFPDEQNIKEGFQLSSEELSLEEFSQQRRTA